MKYLIRSFFILLILTSVASAHPFNVKQWGHRVKVTAKVEQIQIDYKVEIPVSQLMFMIRQFKQINKINEFGPTEEKQFNNYIQDQLSKHISFFVNNKSIPLHWNSNYSKNLGNKGEAGFFDYEVHLIGDIPKDVHEPIQIKIINKNYPSMKSVYLNRLYHDNGIHIDKSNVDNDTDWNSDNVNRNIMFSFEISKDNKHIAQHNHKNHEGHVCDHGGNLLSYLKQKNMTTKAMLISFLVAILLGAGHALSPGHGKALVVAYLVGNKGTIRHVLYLVGVVTIAHVASILILGLVGLVAAQYFVPEYYTPYVSLFSGLLIVGIGIWLFIKRLFKKQTCHCHNHSHSHNHNDDHEHSVSKLSNKPSWKEVLALGISGGIAPCPTGTIVMLTAIAVGKIAFGFSLILFFTFGLSIVLFVLGVFAIKARKLLDRFTPSRIVTKWLPIVSALIVTILGLVILYQGFLKEMIH